MSTKTIAVDTRVYHRLKAEKHEGESFSKLIDRLLAEVRAAHTGSDVLRGLETMPALPARDAEVFAAVVAENRASEDWAEHDFG